MRKTFITQALYLIVFLCMNIVNVFQFVHSLEYFTLYPRISHIENASSCFMAFSGFIIMPVFLYQLYAATHKEKIS